MLATLTVDADIAAVEANGFTVFSLETSPGDGECHADVRKEGTQALDVCFLQSALAEAVATPEADTVLFDGVDEVGPWMPELPGLQIFSDVTIDGSINGGTDKVVFRGMRLQVREASNVTVRNVVVDGSNVPEPHPFDFQFGGILIESSSNVSIESSVVKSYVGPVGTTKGFGIKLLASENNTIRNNLVGLEPDGVTPSGNNNGIEVGASSSNLLEGNVVSGNILGGIGIGSVSPTISPSTEGLPTRDNRIVGNFVGTDAEGMTSVAGAGGISIAHSTALDPVALPPEGNAIEGNVVVGKGTGIALLFTNGNIVSGNNVGVDITGGNALGSLSEGIRLWDADDTEITDNVVSGNGTGIQLGLEAILAGGELVGPFPAERTIVSGNLIGTDATGTRAIPNQIGIDIQGTSNSNRVERDNLISGNLQTAVLIRGKGTERNVVSGNTIGGDLSRLDFIPNGEGVVIRDGASSNQIGLGAILSGESFGNAISGNAGPGVKVLGDQSSSNTIRGNSFVANQGIPIDLGGDGITKNDWIIDGHHDVDSGPNRRQNYPVIASVDRSNSPPSIGGFLFGVPSETFVLDIYRADGTGIESANFLEHHVEAAEHLAEVSVTTDSGGNASFFMGAPTTLRPDDIITASVTDSLGNTSEISPFGAVIHGAIETETLNAITIRTTFTPNFGLTVDQAAALGNFDHFNWINQVVMHPFYQDFADSLPFFDPPFDRLNHIVVSEGNVTTLVEADKLPYYWNETGTDQGLMGKFHLNRNIGPDVFSVPNRVLQFQDTPHDKRFHPNNMLDPNHFIQFQTSLAGILRPIGSLDQAVFAALPFSTVDWKSNYNGSVGGIATATVTDEGKQPGSLGGVFDVLHEDAGGISNAQWKHLRETGCISCEDDTAPSIVETDYKPDSVDNRVNLASAGVIPVAIFNTDMVNVENVDVTSVRFAGAMAVHSGLEDVDGDGDLDLMLHFRVEDTTLLESYRTALTAADTVADGMLDLGISNRQQLEVSLTLIVNDEAVESFDSLQVFLSGRALRDLIDELSTQGML